MSHKGNASLYGAGLCVNGLYQHSTNIKAKYNGVPQGKHLKIISNYIGMFCLIELLNKWNIPDLVNYMFKSSNVQPHKIFLSLTKVYNNWPFQTQWLLHTKPGLTFSRLMIYIYIYICRTAPLTSRRCILYIYSTNTCTEYFKHAAHSPLFPLQIVVSFIMLSFLVPVLFTC
jgi:hypothetical protein